MWFFMVYKYVCFYCKSFCGVILLDIVWFSLYDLVSLNCIFVYYWICVWEIFFEKLSLVWGECFWYFIGMKFYNIINNNVKGKCIYF